MEIHNKNLTTKGRGQRMKALKKAVVTSVISIFLLSGTIPAFCSSSGGTPTPTPTPTTPRADEQRFVPETPQQKIDKANEDTLRYQKQVPPPGTDKKNEKPAGPKQPATAP
jgi:hypothetical protein